MYQQNYYNFHHWSWYMGDTSMSQFHTGVGRFLAAAGFCRKWWCINKLIIILIIELGIWVIQACANFIRGCHVFWLLLVPKEWCINNLSGECSLVPLSLPGDHGSGWMDGWMRTSVRGFDNNGAIVIAALYNACHGNGCKITVTLNLKLNKLLSDENNSGWLLW